MCPFELRIQYCTSELTWIIEQIIMNVNFRSILCRKVNHATCSMSHLEFDIKVWNLGLIPL